MNDTPAFPQSPVLDSKGELTMVPNSYMGISKLEYLAGLAMQGILASGKYIPTKRTWSEDCNGNREYHEETEAVYLAKEAVESASALLREIEGRAK